MAAKEEIESSREMVGSTAPADAAGDEERVRGNGDDDMQGACTGRLPVRMSFSPNALRHQPLPPPPPPPLPLPLPLHLLYRRNCRGEAYRYCYHWFTVRS